MKPPCREFLTLPRIDLAIAQCWLPEGHDGPHESIIVRPYKPHTVLAWEDEK